MRHIPIWPLVNLTVVASAAWWVQHSNAAVAHELGRLSTLASQPTPAPVAPHCVVSVDQNVLRTELQRALANTSLAPPASNANPAQLAEPRSDDTPAEPKPTPSPAAVAAFDAAGTLLDSSLSRGTWTPDDAVHLRRLMASLDPDGRETTALRLVKALNDGKLRRTGGPGAAF